MLADCTAGQEFAENRITLPRRKTLFFIINTLYYNTSSAKMQAEKWFNPEFSDGGRKKDGFLRFKSSGLKKMKKSFFFT